MTPHAESLETERRSHVRAVLSFVLALGIIGVSITLAVVLFLTAPKAEKARDDRSLPAVELLPIQPGRHTVRILTQGVVESRRETSLAAEVGGRVVEISPRLKQGERIADGELLARIDDADYRAAVARAESALAEAELALAQEDARVKQAQIDWERLGRGGAGNPLVLREPQRKAAFARVESAREELARSRRDLERTRITAPFAAAVRSARIEVGAVASPGQAIAEIYSDTDLQLRLPLPLEDYGFVTLDAQGLPVGEIRLRGSLGGESLEWPAESIRLDPEIDRRTLSGHWIVRVRPGTHPAYPLPPVGMFLYAEITCGELENVVEIPRRAIRDTGEVLLVDAEDRLQFRRLEVIRRTAESAVIREGLSAGERLCLTRLNAPVAGMQVRVEEPATP